MRAADAAPSTRGPAPGPRAHRRSVGSGHRDTAGPSRRTGRGGSRPSGSRSWSHVVPPQHRAIQHRATSIRQRSTGSQNRQSPDDPRPSDAPNPRAPPRAPPGRRRERADLRHRHLRPAVRSLGAEPVRRARGHPAAGGDRRTGGQAASPGTGLLRPPGPAHPGRTAGRARPAGRTGAGRAPGGTLHVELNHTDSTVLPAGFRNDSNDSRILACALNLALERPAGRVILVSPSRSLPT